MYRLLLFFLCILHISCFNYLSDKCTEGLWEGPKDRVGDYEFSDIADRKVGIGDTLWITPSNYNRAYNACDYHYGDFFPNLAVSDKEVVSIVKVDNHFAIVGKKKGKSKVKFIGEISLRRNGEDIYVKESMELEVDVIPNLFVQSNTKPKDATDPSFFIENIDIQILKSGKGIELTFEKNPEFINERSDWGEISLVLSNSSNPDSINKANYHRDQGYDRFAVEMDSSFTYMHGVLTIGNSASWDPIKEERIPRINASTGRSFGIRSYPASVQLTERMFEIVYIN